MISTKSESYLTVIGSGFIHPIVTLFETLEEHDIAPPNEVQTSVYENSYSAAIIVLTVLMVESAVGRYQHLMKVSPPKKTLEYIKSVCATNLYKRIEEIFVMRDLIVHNHIWDAETYWGPDGKIQLVNSRLLKGYGDTKYDRCVNQKTCKTKLLGLNVFPTRIWRVDAIIVLKNAYECLSAIESKGTNLIKISELLVKYHGTGMLFSKFLAEISMCRNDQPSIHFKKAIPSDQPDRM